ncbi:MAG: hypothetical protein GF417_01970, partial [Candidatus Latescibacteria bacterium]|nr:hypothetical protein [bacterium]MBD3423195.1 hypothetical protein [Candidatus Latescibacterota bacterium]
MLMRSYLFAIIFLPAIIILPSQRECSAETVTRKIEGGPRVVVDYHPGSPAVCIAVSVGAGSAVETPRTRGITHFIEHMAFNGSERFSREQISDWVDREGVFLNAFTRAENTVFFLLVRNELAGEGIEVLSEMLLHSVFAPSEVEKEKDIIMEEIRETMDNPRHARGRLVQRYLYRGSGLASPVLGYPETVGNISREELIEYYGKYYTPSNMTVFVMGGLSSRKACGMVGDFFYSPVKASGEVFAPGGKVRWSNRLAVRDNTGYAPGLDLLIKISGGRSLVERMAAGTVISSLLSSGSFPLAGRLNEAGVNPPEVSIDIQDNFCALRMSFTCSEGSSGRLKDIPEMLRELSSWEPGSGRVQSAVTAHLSSDMFDREKYHYYIMLHGELMASLGGSYFTEYLGEIEKVDRGSVRDILRESFSEMEFNGCLLRRDEKIDSGNYPSPQIEVLDNGTRIASIRREGSGLAALNILLDGGNCAVDSGEAGMPILLHRVLEVAAAGDGLDETFRGMGARVSWGDNPYIPMDDYLLNPSFSFIRLEAPLPSFEEAAELLIGHIT